MIFQKSLILVTSVINCNVVTIYIGFCKIHCCSNTLIIQFRQPLVFWMYKKGTLVRNGLKTGFYFEFQENILLKKTISISLLDPFSSTCCHRPASLLKISLFHRCFSNILLVKTNYLVYPQLKHWSKMSLLTGKSMNI